MGNKCFRPGDLIRGSLKDDVEMLEAYMAAGELDWSSEQCVEHHSAMNSLHNNSLARVHEAALRRTGSDSLQKTGSDVLRRTGSGYSLTRSRRRSQRASV
eukprot:2222068-Rhodomonas_salina.1